MAKSASNVAEQNPDVQSIPPELLVTVRVTIPTSLFEEYERQAQAQQLSAEDLMASRLRQTVLFNARRGMFWNDKQRDRLETYLQRRPLASAEQAITLLERAGAIEIDGVTVYPSADQKKRLRMGCPRGKTYAEHVTGVVRRALVSFVGI